MGREKLTDEGLRVSLNANLPVTIFPAGKYALFVLLGIPPTGLQFGSKVIRSFGFCMIHSLH